MQSGSMARAASTAPMSSISQPNWVSTLRASALASALWPQMNIDGRTPPSSGFTISVLPTHEKAF
jgi:hypothetical protein